MTIAIRPATPQDAPAIAAVRIDSWRSTYRGLIPDAYLDGMQLEQSTALWDRVLTAGKNSTSVFVAENDGDVVGFAAGNMLQEPRHELNAELTAIYLRPDYQHAGIGRRLVESVARAEQAHGANGLIVWVISGNKRARAFYEALGWSGAQQPDGEVCFFQAGPMVFGLWTALGGHGAPGIELAHNVRSPQEVRDLLAEAERAGATIVRPAAEAEWGGTSGAFADPDGYVWEVAHNPGWTIRADGTIRI